MSANDTIYSECKDALGYAHGFLLLRNKTVNRPFARSGRMVQSHTCCDASCMLLTRIIVELPALSQQLCKLYLFSAFNFFADGFLCNSTGNFPDQNDCRKFYSCYRIGKDAFQSFHYICPSHSPFYHAKKQTCRSISGGLLNYNYITFFIIINNYSPKWR